LPRIALHKSSGATSSGSPAEADGVCASGYFDACVATWQAMVDGAIEGWRRIRSRSRDVRRSVLVLCGAVAVGVAVGMSAIQLHPSVSAMPKLPKVEQRIAGPTQVAGPGALRCCGLRALSVRSRRLSTTVSARSSPEELDYLTLLTRMRQMPVTKRLVVHVATNAGELIMRAEVGQGSQLSAWIAPRLLRR
jgi:hypothetical protein